MAVGFRLVSRRLDGVETVLVDQGGLESACIACEPPRSRQQHAVVRADERVLASTDDDRVAVGPDTGVDDHEMRCRRKIGEYFAKPEGGRPDVLSGEVMGDVDQPSVRSLSQDAFHHCRIRRAEVRSERDHSCRYELPAHNAGWNCLASRPHDGP